MGYGVTEAIKYTDSGGVNLTEINEIEQPVLYSKNPGFENLTGGDYRLKKNSTVYEDFPGFTAPGTIKV